MCLCVTGALLKAVCVCSGLVSLTSQHPLGHQLMEWWGGGVELHSWSELPTGSGLGEKQETELVRDGGVQHFDWSSFCRYQQHPGGGAVGRGVQVYQANL